MMNEHYELTFNKNTNDSQEEILRTSDSLDDLYDYLEDLLSADEDDGNTVAYEKEFGIDEGHIRRVVILDNNSYYTLRISF